MGTLRSISGSRGQSREEEEAEEVGVERRSSSRDQHVTAKGKSRLGLPDGPGKEKKGRLARKREEREGKGRMGEGSGSGQGLTPRLGFLSFFFSFS